MSLDESPVSDLREIRESLESDLSQIAVHKNLSELKKGDFVFSSPDMMIPKVTMKEPYSSLHQMNQIHTESRKLCKVQK